MNKKIDLNLIQAKNMKTIITLSSLKIAKNAVLLVFILFLSSELFAQHGQYVLDGSSNPDSSVDNYNITSNTNGVTPFTLNRKAARSRYLYLASELRSEGPGEFPSNPAPIEREITSLAFYVTSYGNGNSYALQNYNITLAKTTASNLSDNMDALVDAVVVKSIASLKITANGWYDIEFDTPYTWDGESNIIVEICKTSSTAGGTNVKVAATKFKGDDSKYRTFAGYTNINNSTAVDGCNMITSPPTLNTAFFSSNDSSRKIRPNIRFTFKCTSATSIEVAEIKTNDDCLVELQVVNGQSSSGSVYQWYKKFVGESDDEYREIVGATFPNLTVTMEEVGCSYRRGAGCSIGNYNFSSSVEVGAATPGTLNNWNGVTWSLGHPPTNEQIVKINGDFDSNDNLVDGLLEACSLLIESGTVTIHEGDVIHLNGKLKVKPTATVVFKNNASLVQDNNGAVNEGKIKYKRNSQSVRLLDYTYWSSPVSGLKPIDFSSGTPLNRIYLWNHEAAVQNWKGGASVYNNPMVAGKGYIIRAPNGFPSSGVGQVFEGEFFGVPHNGEIKVATQGKNPNAAGQEYYNLIGNPYPSAVDMDIFLKNNKNKIDGTVKYWTHNSTPNGTYGDQSQAFNYNPEDYATYNLTGYVGSVAESGQDPSDPAYVPNTTVPGQYIAAGQSFMVAGGPDTGIGSVIFNNEMRVVGDNNTFFRTTNAIETIEKHRFWLEMLHEEGAFKQTLVGYIEEATNDLDWGFDGKMSETASVLIYTKAEDQNLIIQGKALPFADSDIIPLGFSTTLTGVFNLNLYQFDGLFADQVIYVEDTYTNIIHNLKDGIYTFNSVPGVFDDRFVIRFTNETLGVNPVVSQQNTIICYVKNSIITVKALDQILNQVNVFDATGRLLFNKKSIQSGEFQIESIAKTNQLLLVQVTTDEGIKATYKIIY